MESFDLWRVQERAHFTEKFHMSKNTPTQGVTVASLSQDSSSLEMDDEESNLFKKIPTDGTSVGNMALRKSLGWDVEKYWPVRDRLVEKEFVSTGMGRGGSVFRLKDILSDSIQEQSGQKQKTKQYSLERDLYLPVSNALEKWAKEVLFQNYLIEDISAQGSRRTGGIWTRPDLVLVNVETYQYVPNKYLEVITFEVKPDDGWEIEAVFEAAAHSRFASRSYLAIHKNSSVPPSQELFDRFEEECKRFGVGLIVFDDPEDYDTYSFIVEPLRKNIDPRETEKFIETQVNTANKKKISRWLR
jgi:hypothetical protein